MLLTADLHLTDNPDDDYRWKVFDYISDYFDKHNDDDLYILGDLSDRRDKHGSVLINRLVQRLDSLAQARIRTTILKGNHDAPLRGTPYWEFLSAIPDVQYISEPTGFGDLLLLPASQQPDEEWANTPWDQYNAVFMHQTVNGAYLGNGIHATVSNVPKFPKHLKVYSGDLHVPHKHGNVVYVGAPHPKNYGDDHECRLLALDKHYDIKDEIILTPPRKLAIEVSSLNQLRKIDAKKGDMARIKFNLDPKRIEQWPAEREALAEWAKSKGVTLTSIESFVEHERTEKGVAPDKEYSSPLEVLTAYADAEGIDDDLYETGKRLLEGNVQ